MNIIGGENVATGPMFVKRVKIEKDSTDVDIRVAIVSTLKRETQTTMELIKSTHEDYAYGLNGKGLIYKIFQPDQEDRKYDRNAVRLRFEVKFIEGEGIQDFLTPVISNPISMILQRSINQLHSTKYDSFLGTGISDDKATIQGMGGNVAGGEMLQGETPRGEMSWGETSFGKKRRIAALGVDANLAKPNPSVIIICGGKSINDVEVLSENNSYKVPDLPFGCIFTPLMCLHNGVILVHHDTRLFQLRNNNWIHHSGLNKTRYSAAIATTKSSTTFIFGGKDEPTYEYLEKNSTTWKLGRTKIPDGFRAGQAIPTSEDEIWLIGGYPKGDRILSFNIYDHTFKELPLKLINGGKKLKCSIIPGTNNIMVISNDGVEAEILNVEEKNVTKTASLNIPRLFFGMGVLAIDNQERLVVFGGDGKDSVEAFYPESGMWKISDIRLTKPKYCFGSLSTFADSLLH